MELPIYDEITREPLTEPDLSAGYLYSGYRVTGREEEHLEVMEGTVTEARPQGLRRLVPARNITEACRYYHAYTAQELEAQHTPSQLDRVEAQAFYTAMMTDTMLEEV